MAVRNCQAYVGIFAMRYGSIDPQSGKSITEMEYNEAQSLKLPSLIYILDEERQPILPKYVDTGESATSLKNLKSILKKSHVVSYFTTPDDLAKRIILDLPTVAARAWRRGTPWRVGEDRRLDPRIDLGSPRNALHTWLRNWAP